MKKVDLEQPLAIEVLDDEGYEVEQFLCRHVSISVKGGERILRMQEEAVDLIEKLVPGGAKAGVLDLSSAESNIPLELAVRGFPTPTKVAATDEELGTLERQARLRDVKLKLVVEDARKIKYPEQHDAVTMMDSAFGAFPDDEDNQQVLIAIAQSLRSGGVLILDCSNRDERVTNLIEKSFERVDDSVLLEEEEFDPVSLDYTTRVTTIDPKGGRAEVEETRKLYTLQDIRRLLVGAKLEFAEVFGDYQGDDFSAKSPRMIVVARKG